MNTVSAKHVTLSYDLHTGINRDICSNALVMDRGSKLSPRSSLSGLACAGMCVCGLGEGGCSVARRCGPGTPSRSDQGTPGARAGRAAAGSGARRPFPRPQRASLQLCSLMYYEYLAQ